MKLLLVLENHFYIDENGTVWCNRVVDYDFLKRYLKVFKEVVVCGRATKEKNSDYKLKVTGERVSFAPIKDFYGAFGLIKNFFSLKKSLKKYIKDVDCVIFRAPTPLSVFTYNEVLKQDKPLGIEFMIAADKMFDGDSFLKRILNSYIVRIAKKLCMKANGVSYVTNHVLQDEYPCQAIINGESSEYFTESYSTIDLNDNDFCKMKWNIEKKPKTIRIIHTGYMDTYRKGQDTLIKAVKKVYDEGFDISLTLIGDGKKRTEFEKMVEKLELSQIVTFKGMIKDKKTILKLLSDSHLMVFPTHSEGLPRTLIEAMAVGLPCISSPVDGVPELLDDDLLVNYDDIDGYKEKIIELISDWKYMTQLSEKNYNKALEYNKKNLDKKRTSFYEKLSKLSKIKNNIKE